MCGNCYLTVFACSVLVLAGSLERPKGTVLFMLKTSKSFHFGLLSSSRSLHVPEIAGEVPLTHARTALPARLNGENHSNRMIHHSEPRHAFRWFNDLIGRPLGSPTLQYTPPGGSLSPCPTPRVNISHRNISTLAAQKSTHTSTSVI